MEFGYMSKLFDNESRIPSRKPRLGISACLLGQPVRFDGGHKQDSFIQTSLASHIECVPACPEVEAGFAIPRPTMQLRLQGEDTRLVMSKGEHEDVTQKMTDFASKKMKELSWLDGFIFKKNSPSCGAFRVPVVINKHGYREKNGTGVFAKTFMQRYPLIPVEEEGRLNDAGIRENFIERVFAYQRWKDVDNSIQGLTGFHSRHKLMLMARGSHYYQELGRFVAETTTKNLCQRRDMYIHRFMQVMKVIPSNGKQTNVLLHIMGYLKKALSHEDKKELLEVFEAYRQQQLPLITAVTMLRHYLRLYPQPYIEQQHYLTPFPEQLALRSVI